MDEWFVKHFVGQTFCLALRPLELPAWPYNFEMACLHGQEGKNLQKPAVVWDRSTLRDMPFILD